MPADKRPTVDQIVNASVTAGATPEISAQIATVITEMMAQSPDANSYLPEFNNAIERRWIDLHSDATIYDRFKHSASKPTLQSVVFEKVAPVDFNYGTDISKLPKDEQTETRKVPPIHSILKSINVEQRYKTTSSQIELDKIEDEQSISVDQVVATLGMDYADEHTDKFIALVNGITSARIGDIINPMDSLENVSTFIQDIKYYQDKFKEKRSPDFNSWTLPQNPNARSWTKMNPEDRPIAFIDPKKLNQIEGDYYATLIQLAEALPDVDFVKVDGMTDNVYCIMCDPRVVEWAEFYREIRSEQIRGRESGELNHYLFAKEIMGSYDCFNRMKFRTQASAQTASRSKKK